MDGKLSEERVFTTILSSHNNSIIKWNEELGSGVIEIFSSIFASLKKKFMSVYCTRCAEITLPIGNI